MDDSGPSDTAASQPRDLRVFMCYRRNDGAWHAEWLNKQLANIEFNDSDNKPSDADGALEFEDRIRERILGAIRQSERATTFEDLERLRGLTRRLTWALSLALLLLLATAYAGYEAYRFSQKAERNSEIAEEQARLAIERRDQFITALAKNALESDPTEDLGSIVDIDVHENIVLITGNGVAISDTALNTPRLLFRHET